MGWAGKKNSKGVLGVFGTSVAFLKNENPDEGNNQYKHKNV